MNKTKAIIGIIILVNMLPVLAGLATLNGEFCYHGYCEDVTPFFGGYIRILLLEAIGAFIILISRIVIDYFFDQKTKQK